MRRIFWLSTTTTISLSVLLVMFSLTRGFLSPSLLFLSSWRKVLSSSTSTTCDASSSSSAAAVLQSVHSDNIPSHKDIHVVILVHGYMGNPAEMGYLQEALEKLSVEHNDHFIIHSAVANDGQTSDGIAAGGERLAAEVNSILAKLLLLQQQQQQQHSKNNSTLSLSFVGNSLGGLYARYALSSIDDYFTTSPRVVPRVFCTTASPFLGVSQHTYLPLPRRLEYLVANVLQQTGRDLFRLTTTTTNAPDDDDDNDIIAQLALQDKFVRPLSKFQTRIAYANAFATDFQVPMATAAFLAETDSPHHVVVEVDANDNKNENPDFVSLIVKTPKRPRRRREPTSIRRSTSSSTSADVSSSPAELATTLDALGWTKVFCDVRNHLLSIPLFFSFSSKSSSWNKNVTKKKHFDSLELLQAFRNNNDNRRWYVPFGHTVLIANSKNAVYARLNAGGRAIMDHLARRVIRDIVSTTTTDTSQQQE